MAYGARLESVLGATPHEFESRILRSRLNRRNEEPDRSLRSGSSACPDCSFGCIYRRHLGHILKQERRTLSPSRATDADPEEL